MNVGAFTGSKTIKSSYQFKSVQIYEKKVY
jgi:hypothetical protein